MLPCVSEHITITDARHIACPDERFASVLRGERFLLFDGAMGTMLQARGVDVSSHAQDFLNIENPALVEELLGSYVEAGCDVVTTNTFRSNADILGTDASVADVYDAAVQCAHRAGARYVAAEIGPTGKMFEPYGDLSFEHAYELFAQQARAAREAACDLILVETLTDLLESKAALLAVKENTDLPVFVSMSFGKNGRTMMGVTPEAAARTFSALGASALGVNCSVGPDLLLSVVQKIIANSSVPVIAQPNAGLPTVVDGNTTYDMTPERFVEAYAPMLDAGVTVLGSCCGTDPSYTACLRKLADAKEPAWKPGSEGRVITSARACVEVTQEALQAAARIELAGAYDAASVSNAFFMAMDADAAVYALDVTGLAESEAQQAVMGLQSVCTAPLWFASDDERAVEAAVRVYAGCPLIGTPGAARSTCMQVIAAHYGCVLA